MHRDPETSLLNIERELQLIDEEFSSAPYGREGKLGRADDEALFRELSAAMDLQHKRSEHMHATLQESFDAEEAELDFPVHTRESLPEETDQNIQKFMQEMSARDTAIRGFQGSMNQSMKHIDNIHDILIRAHRSASNEA